LFPNYLPKIDAYSFFYIREVSFGKTAFLNEGKTETTERKRIMIEQQYSSLLSSSSSFLTDEPRKGSYCSKKMCWRTHDPTQCRRRKEKKIGKKLVEIASSPTVRRSEKTSEKRKKREQTTGRLLIKSGS